MKMLMRCCGVALLFGATRAPAQTNDINARILEELKGIREALTAIAADLKAAPRAGAVSPAWTSFDDEAPDVGALNAIQLPDLTDKDAVRRYVRNIITVSRNQHTFSDRDPQVRLLSNVGQENVDVLVDALKGRHGMGDYHVKAAILRLAGPQHKDMILEALPLNHELADVVEQNGWAQDARDTLIDELKSKPGYLPQSWLTCTAELHDPEADQLLVQFFIHGNNRWCTWDIVRDLPITNLAEVVDQAWNEAKMDRDYEEQTMARIAAEYGHLDALDVLIGLLSSNDPDDSWRIRESRHTLMSVLDVRGSNDDIAAWYGKHRDQLVFDPAAKKFAVQ